MYVVSNLSVYFPGKELLNCVSFIINYKDKIGLVGRNGSGKTTLLNIIAGKHKPDNGSVVIPEGKTVGFLKQELKKYSNTTVIEEAMSAFAEHLQTEEEIKHITFRIEQYKEHDDLQYIKLLSVLAGLHDRLNYLDNARKEGHVEKILKGLGFGQEDFSRKMNEFSGGWQMRVELAKILLTRPDLLLLDEPTNHLDIESIIWFEDFLKNYSGAVVLVSHDKTFLNNVCNRTIEIINGDIYDYKLKYEDFLIFREQRLETQRNAAKNQQRFIEQQERFIERFRAKNTKARQVRSKIKRLEKIERIEFDEVDLSNIRFRFSKSPHSGNLIFEGNHITKHYGDKLVLDDLNFRIERGDRIAFVGKNGEGKTTMVKILMKLIDFEGILKIGHQIKTGYYAQVQEHTLDENLTVYETIERISTGEWSGMQKIRTLLGVFLFGDDDMDKKVKVLSGGEKSRLALAKLILTPANVLILDEPTNHLDIPSKEVLKSALKEFDGTLILVSHDRDFLDGLTSKTFEFSGKKIREHPGGIRDFLSHHKVETFREFEKSQKVIPDNNSRNFTVSSSKENYLSRKENEKELKKLKNKLSALEKMIMELENREKELEKLMDIPENYTNPEKALTLSHEYDLIKKTLLEKLQEWEEIIDKLKI